MTWTKLKFRIGEMAKLWVSYCEVVYVRDIYVNIPPHIQHFEKPKIYIYTYIYIYIYIHTDIYIYSILEWLVHVG